MNGIGDYLRKFTGLHETFFIKKDVFIKSVLEVSGVDVSQKKIEFKNKEVYVSGLNSTERNLILIKTKDILSLCGSKNLHLTGIK